MTTDTAMRWFGPSWNAPLNDDCAHAPTPVGEKCARCDEPIVMGDQGVLMFHIELTGSAFRPLHRACFLRQTIGGIGHVLLHGKGRCNGECLPDPEWLSRRKAAEIAVQLWELAPWPKP